MPEIRIICHHQEKSLPRLRYVLDFLERHPLSPPGIHFVEGETGSSDLTIGYGVNQGDFSINNEGQFLLEENWQNWRATDFQTFEKRPFKFGKENLFGINFGKVGVGEKIPFLQEGRFEMDVFANLFFHLSRVEEWLAAEDQLDAHERIKSSAQFLVRENLYQQPVVDQIVSAFFTALGFSPKERSSVIHLTHDIDWIQKFDGFWKFARQAASIVFHQKSLSQLLRLKMQFFKTILGREADPYVNFDWLLAENGVGERVIYFLAGGTRPNLEKHFDIESPEARNLIRLAREKGYAIGLHPSYDAHRDAQLFHEQLKKLESISQTGIRHSRQHYLRWKFPETPNLIEKNGLAVDSTLGYADRMGFRCGTGFDFALYNFKEERAYRFLERPLVLMDIAWLREVLPEFPQRRISNKALETAAQNLEDFFSKNRFNTAICVNFHNSTFDGVNLSAQLLKKIYLEKIVRNSNK